jgi:transposase
MLPKDFPPFTTVEGYFYERRDDSLFGKINFALLLQPRDVAGREASPSTGSDPQSIGQDDREQRAAELDAANTIKGRKRHIMTDAGGLLLGAEVHTADIQDCDVTVLVIEAIHRLFSWVSPPVRHSVYNGPSLRAAPVRFGNWTAETVKRAADAAGFQLLPRRWVVERTPRLAQSDTEVKMEKDGFELVTGPVGETGHCENTTQMATETTSPPHRELRDGYDASRFNALRHGVLSAHTVLPWEDKTEYEGLLNALVKEYASHGPTEEHLVEEIAGVIWRKRRLRLAEAASHRRGIKKATAPFSHTLDIALNQVERALPLGPIIDAISATPSVTAKELAELNRRNASLRQALELLSVRKPGAYEAALAELDERSRASWQEQLAPEPEETNDEDSDEGSEPSTDDAARLAEYLAEYLEHSVLPRCAEQLTYVANRSVIRTQVLGEALDCNKLERLGRYEVHLDRKLERMLAMLLRLQDFRRSNKIG